MMTEGERFVIAERIMAVIAIETLRVEGADLVQIFEDVTDELCDRMSENGPLVYSVAVRNPDLDWRD